MSLKTEIIYEDGHVIVIYKPAGLAVQSARASQEDVCSQLKSHLKGGYLGLIHRLDQPVEGLLVFAKDKKTAAELSADLGTGKLKKSYLAVAFGEIEESGRDVCYMRKNPGGECEIGEGEGYKRAELSYEVLEKREGSSLRRVRIETGRFHQIRAQMAHLGHPLLGDAKYGSSDSSEYSKERGIVFPALCADRLSFTEPGSAEIREFSVHPKNTAFTLYDHQNY